MEWCTNTSCSSSGVGLHQQVGLTSCSRRSFRGMTCMLVGGWNVMAASPSFCESNPELVVLPGIGQSAAAPASRVSALASSRQHHSHNHQQDMLARCELRSLTSASQARWSTCLSLGRQRCALCRPEQLPLALRVQSIVRELRFVDPLAHPLRATESLQLVPLAFRHPQANSNGRLPFRYWRAPLPPSCAAACFLIHEAGCPAKNHLRHTPGCRCKTAQDRS